MSTALSVSGPLPTNGISSDRVSNVRGSNNWLDIGNCFFQLLKCFCHIPFVPCSCSDASSLRLVSQRTYGTGPRLWRAPTLSVDFVQLFGGWQLRFQHLKRFRRLLSWIFSWTRSVLKVINLTWHVFLSLIRYHTRCLTETVIEVCRKDDTTWDIIQPLG